MKILVTGGCGYIGTVLTQALLDQGHEVTVFDIMWFGNVLSPHKNLKVVQGDIREAATIPLQGIDAVIHLANVANDPCGELDSKLAWEVNVLSSKLLIERAIKHKVKQFIYASSGSVYGVKEEAQVTEDLELVPVSDYNKTKMISERVFLSYQRDIVLQCIRPATVCGFSPRMRLDVSVNMMASQALTKKRMTVFGGNQTRPNIHMKDMVGVYLHFLQLEDKARGIFNAGFENISILDIANMVARHVPAEIVISESNDPRSYRLNSDKLLASGFKPRYGIEDAIKDLVTAYHAGTFKDEDNCYNIRTMKKIYGARDEKKG